MYTCSNCNLAVIVIGEKVIKGCRCDAAIHASISANLKGYGGITTK